MAKLLMLPLSLIFVFLTTVISLVSPPSAYAEVVSARLHQEDNGRTTFIEMQLSKPAPATLIIEMKLPKGSTIIETRPTFSKQNKKNHSVKWLMKNVKPGTSTIKIVTQTELAPGSTTVVIRYRDSDDGKLKEVIAKKP